MDNYSPTGNSWNQSDVDSEYHRFDPKRYEGRPIDEKANESESQMSRFNPNTYVPAIDTSDVTSFADLVEHRRKQGVAKKKKVELQDHLSVSLLSSRQNSRVGSSSRRRRGAKGSSR